MLAYSGRFFSRAAVLLMMLPLFLLHGGAPANAATTTSSAGRILYLAADGVTIRSLRPDGTDPHVLYTVKTVRGQTVSNLSADPTGSYILYSVSSEGYDPAQGYYLLHNGAVKKLPVLADVPRWSPDGKRFVGQSYTTDGSPGKVFIYNVTNDTYLYLPVTGLPDWFPDGNRLVYTDGGDVFTYSRMTGAVAKLTKLPHEDKRNDWEVLEAHVLPSGNRIIFFGQEFYQNGDYMIGASGNGLQWFWIPATGGAPQPWLGAEGNGLVAYASSHATNKVAYAGNAHSSACASIEGISVLSASQFPGQPIFHYIPGFNPDLDKLVYINGLGFSPSGTQLVYSVTPYTCDSVGVEPLESTPIIYTWTVPASITSRTVQAHKVANGTFPVWVK